jgi:Helix-hairpin-helix motif
VSGAAPRAGGAVVLALAAGLALPGFVGPSEPAPCAAPGSRLEASGRTIEAACGGGAPLRGPARLLYGLRLDANRAGPAELEVLPQIGPARAAALVRARQKRPFCAPADLERVPGIGPSRRKALEPWLEFAEGSACPQGPGPQKRTVPGGSASVR